MKPIKQYSPSILEVLGFEIVLLVARNEKRCDRVCVQMFDMSASET